MYRLIWNGSSKSIFEDPQYIRYVSVICFVIVFLQLLLSSLRIQICVVLECKHSKVDQTSAPVYESRDFLGQTH